LAFRATLAAMGRRKVTLEEASGWVFNRMADVYHARPPYPAPLVEAVAELAGGMGARVADLGAGIGHLTLPLAERGLLLTAIEPARAMLDRLAQASAARGLSVRALHATAEALPLEDRSCDLVLIADALHFLDAELTGRQVARVLTARGALAIITCQLADTPFMRALKRAMEDAAPRRPRDIRLLARQLSAVASVPLTERRCFADAIPVDEPLLEQILRSISYIGPAMSRERFAAFRSRVFAIAEPPVWSRTFTLESGRRT
jgi:SAM-dependent methyltransferase